MGGCVGSILLTERYECGYKGGSMDHKHREGMMTDVSDATFVWKVLNKTGQILHIKWKILCKYLKKKKYFEIRWSGCLEDTIYKYLAKINRSDKYLTNIWEIFEKYLWDHRVRADDRDWLLWADLLFGPNNRTNLPLLNYIDIHFIIIIYLVLLFR